MPDYASTPDLKTHVPRVAYEALLLDFRDMRQRAEVAERAYDDLHQTVAAHARIYDDGLRGWLDRVVERVERARAESSRTPLDAITTKEVPDRWPVLPDGIEAVTIHKTPTGWTPPPEDCFVCDEPMPDAESGETCWGIPGRGVAHSGCYEVEGDDDA